MKKFLLSTLTCVFLLTAALGLPALAANPEDALSAQSSDSCYYMALRLDNFGDLVRWILSRENLSILGPSMGLDADFIPLITRTAAQCPAESVALLFGISANRTPTVQVALSMPDTLQSQLKAVAEGRATSQDVLTLLLGKDTPAEAFFGNMVNVARGNGYITVGDMLFMTAKDNLLLLSIMPDGLKASIAALNDKKARFAPKRRFDAKDFILMHIDYAQLEKILPTDDEDGEELKKNLTAVTKMFKAPFEIEFAFTNTPDKFVINGACNIKDCMTKNYVDSLKAITPVRGGHMKLFGSGSPLLALGFNSLSLDTDAVALEDIGSDIKEAIDELLEIISSSVGLSRNDLAALMKGGVSISAAGKALFLNGRIPGLAIALTGDSKIAASLIDKLSKDDKIPFGLTDINGFDKALQLDPSVAPVPAMIGVQGDTLVISVMDKASLEAEPNPSPEMQALLNTKSNGVFYIDFEAARSFMVDLSNGVRGMLNIFDEELAGIIMDVLDVELSVPNMALYSPTVDSVRIEFTHAKINPERGLWAKLAPYLSMFLEDL